VELQVGPRAKAILAGDRQLGEGERGELTGPAPALGLVAQVAQIRPSREETIGLVGGA
jgi:hypothetical protein